jgi:hypothetical protein
MPPTARGGVGAVSPADGDGVTEGGAVVDGDCDGVTEVDSEGVTDGVCDGVVAGVSEGVMLGGVRPDCGCAKAALASASTVAKATDLRVIAFSVEE